MKSNTAVNVVEERKMESPSPARELKVTAMWPEALSHRSKALDRPYDSMFSLASVDKMGAGGGMWDGGTESKANEQ